MTQCNTLSIKLSNWQINRFKSGIKNGTEVTLKISSNVVGDSNDENNFLHKLWLTNTQVSRLCKAFANGSSANTTSKTQLHKIRQSGGFLSRLLGPLLKTGLPLIGNILKPLAKSVVIPLGLTAAVAAATDAAIHKKMFRPGCPLDLAYHATTPITSNEEINDIIKRVKSLGESGLLIKGVSETIKNEAKKQKAGFLRMLLGASGASLLLIYKQVKA